KRQTPGQACPPGPDLSSLSVLGRRTGSCQVRFMRKYRPHGVTSNPKGPSIIPATSIASTEPNPSQRESEVEIAITASMITIAISSNEESRRTLSKPKTKQNFSCQD